MSALWVLLELVPLGALACLICAVAFTHVNAPGCAPDDRQVSDGEPEWWPEFEREFALYVAKI